MPRQNGFDKIVRNADPVYNDLTGGKAAGCGADAGFRPHHGHSRIRLNGASGNLGGVRIHALGKSIATTKAPCCRQAQAVQTRLSPPLAAVFSAR